MKKFAVRIVATLVAVVGFGLLAGSSALAASIGVNTPADIAANDGRCSLREAVIAANVDLASGALAGECPAGLGTDTISLPAATYVLTSPLPDLTTPMTINGAGATATIIDADHTGRIFTIVQTEVAIDSMRLTNGLAARGGAIHVQGGALGGGLELTNAEIINNESTGSFQGNGGGLYSDGDLTLAGTLFSGNIAAESGGGAFVNGDYCTDDCGIEYYGHDVSMTDLTFSDNIAADAGGGLNYWRPDRSQFVTDSKFLNNEAAHGGGVFVVTDPEFNRVVFENVTVAGNVATVRGGGMRIIGAVEIDSSTIDGNDAPAGGGIHAWGAYGIFDSYVMPAVVNSTISNNVATTFGGGIYGDLAIDSSTISGNTADIGGGWTPILGGELASAGYTTITNNTANRGSGIGFDDESGFVRVSYSIVAGNNGPGEDIGRKPGPTPYPATVSGGLGYNVLGTVQVGVTADTSPGDVVGQTSVALGSLADNGGTTLTHAVLDGSMAVDRVPGGSGEDQRGVTRPQGPASDSGAFEGVGLTAPMCNGLLVTINLATNGGNGLGTTSTDVILGIEGPDTINARGGADTICGLGGADDIDGGGGPDLIFGGAGADTISGGPGADTIFGGPGADTISGGPGGDTIEGEDGPDTISGQASPDTLNGGPGGDTISGQNGADTINGGNGHDILKGQTGPDTMRGGTNNDNIAGGNGNDILYGDLGTDHCAGNLGPADQAEAATCETVNSIEVLF